MKQSSTSAQALMAGLLQGFGERDGDANAKAAGDLLAASLVVRACRAIGFTGTRRGMTPAQASSLRSLLRESRAVLHHGDAVGADAEAHELAVELGLRIVIHPPRDGRQRAYKSAADVRDPKHFLARNKRIVRETEALIAMPAEAEEQLRSGTWSTIRYARKVGRTVFIILPDGTVQGGRT